MPTDVLFIHSAGSQADQQGSTPFLAHLRRQLGAGYRVNGPAMPAPGRPSYPRWKAELETLLPAGSSAPLLIGHSLGGSVLLKYLSEQEPKIRAIDLFVVAAPFWGQGGWQVDEFVLREDFARHLPLGLKVHLYLSKDDAVVTADHLSRYAEAIPGATVRLLETGGHAFQDGLPELTADIQALRATAAGG